MAIDDNKAMGILEDSTLSRVLSWDAHPFPLILGDLKSPPSPSQNPLSYLFVMGEEDFNNWQSLALNDEGKDWVKFQEFKANAGSILTLTDSFLQKDYLTSIAQTLSCEVNLFPRVGHHHALLVINPKEVRWDFASAFEKLPASCYLMMNVQENLTTPPALNSKALSFSLEDALLGFAMAIYQFNYFKKDDGARAKELYPTLFLTTKFHPLVQRIEHIVKAIFMGRDLINLPASHLNPTSMGQVADKLANDYQAKIKQIIGDELIQQNYPLIYTVGKASYTPPRLIDMHWQPRPSNPQASNLMPKITLIGKGVTFDSGGLNIKPSSNMKLMKKDMGGAATALTIARMIMALNLKVQLRVLIPTVENAVAGNAYRQMDVITSRNGTTVEIGDTDAEGRLILADAITAAGEENTDIILDFATLTGAARVALGTDLPAIFCNDSELAQNIIEQGLKEDDPCWQLPLHKPYRSQIKGSSAQITNAPSSGYAGAIHAALFLEHFVPNQVKWAHFDMMAWNLSKRPARPEGGEVNLVRTILSFIQKTCDNA